LQNDNFVLSNLSKARLLPANNKMWTINRIVDSQSVVSPFMSETAVY